MENGVRRSGDASKMLTTAAAKQKPRTGRNGENRPHCMYQAGGLRHYFRIARDSLTTNCLALLSCHPLYLPLDNQEERSILTSPEGQEEEEYSLMAEKQGDLVQGTLDMLILKVVALEPIHGYGIALRIEQISKSVFKMNAGSLFVALQRLHRAGLIKSEWKASENNRRAKYYALTENGRKRLGSETQEWRRQVAAIARILEA